MPYCKQEAETGLSKLVHAYPARTTCDAQTVTCSNCNEEYTYQADKEEFELAKASATNFLTGEIDEEELEGALEGWTHEGEIWTSPNGNKFTLNGEVPEKKEDEEVEEVKDDCLSIDILDYHSLKLSSLTNLDFLIFLNSYSC